MSTRVWSAPGMPALTVLTVLGFSGYALLIPVAPLWVLHGGAGRDGAGLVNGVMLGATVATQFAVPGVLRRLGWGAVMATGLLLLAAPALLLPLTDRLWSILGLTAVRGVGFGVLTVAGSSAAGLLVDPLRRGAAIGAYGLAVALPNVLLLPLGPVLVQSVGFPMVFWLALLPALGAPLAFGVGRQLHADQEEPHQPGVPVGALLRPSVVLLAATAAGGAVITFAPQMVADQGTATVTLLVLGVTTAISRWLVGGPADRRGSWLLIPWFVLLTGAGLGLVAWATRDPGLEVAGPGLLLTAVALLGAGYGALQNLTLVAALAAVPRARTHAASAMWNAGFDLGTAAGSVVAGSIAATSGFPSALFALAATCWLTFPLGLGRRRG